MYERNFQSKLIDTLKTMFPGCIIVKNDPRYIQGIPDLFILYEKKWAALETKRSSNASHRANQDYYISKLDKMSFAKFINPENKKEVLHDLQQAFKS